MQISTLNLALTRIETRGQAAFNPLSLFANGEPGVWYDPSDFSTMFTNPTGGVTNTGFEQSVGLILDKSKGLALGTENVANGSFAEGSGAGWTVGGEWVIFDGYAQGTGSDLGTLLGYTFVSSLAANKVFLLTFTISNLNEIDGGNGTVELAGGTQYGITSNGNKTIYIVTTVPASSLIFTVGLGSVYDVTNISVKEVAGNHARQLTQVSPNRRPILSARYNLLDRTEEFNNAIWVKNSGVPITVDPNFILAPNSTLTADKIIRSATGGESMLRRSSPAQTVSTRNTLSVYAKEGTVDNLLYMRNLAVDDSPATGVVKFNLTGAGSFDLTFGFSYTGNGSINSVGDGWYRCSITGTTPASIANNLIDIGLTSSLTFSGTINDFLYLWGASLVPADQTNIPYQRVVSGGNYDTDATKYPPYLKFDGVTSSELDALATINTVDFSGTDKVNATVGIRNTGTLTGTLYELTNTFSSAKGFGVSCPSTGGANTIRGYQNAVSSTATPTTGFPPNTFVANFAYNNANSPANQANVVGRINAGTPTSPIFNTGGGNFANDILYIGARNQSGSYFNGNLYSLIIRGAASTPTQIADTETYVNSKTKAY